MRDLAFTPGKRIPVSLVKRRRPTAAKAATKSIGSAAKAGGLAVGAGARTAGRAAGDAAHSAATAARSARRGAKNGLETGRAAVQFARNVTPPPRERSTPVHRVPAVAAAIAAGASLEYLLDPADGKRRRHMLRDRSAAASRRLARRGAQRVGHGEGAVRAATSTPQPVDDQTLAERVPAPTGGPA
jgi:hypothetical protein